MAKNYYAILGVLPTATLDEIRSAYRNRAKQFHPDYSHGDSAPFLRLQEAYEVLGDPENRRVYDRGLDRTPVRSAPVRRPDRAGFGPRKSPVEPLPGFERPGILGEVFPRTSFGSPRPSLDEISGRLWDPRGRPSPPKAEQFRTPAMEIRVTPEQARRGGRVRVSIPVRTACDDCGGTGGAGFFACRQCDGTGQLLCEFPLDVDYPPGIHDSYRVAIPLARYGMPELCPVLVFRIGGSEDFEDLF